jgi:hypothetical protein
LASRYAILAGAFLHILGAAICLIYAPRNLPQDRFVWEYFSPLTLFGSIMYLLGAHILFRALWHRRLKAARKYLKPADGAPKG